MDWMTFTIEIAKALAWPLAVVVLVLIFATPVKTLMEELRSRVRKLSWGGASVEFEARRVADAIQAQNAAGIRQSDKSNSITKRVQDAVDPVQDDWLLRNIELARSDPNAATLNVYERVEYLIRALALKHLSYEAGDLSKASFLRLVGELRDAGVLTEIDAHTLREFALVATLVKRVPGKMLSPEIAHDLVVGINLWTTQLVGEKRRKGVRKSETNGDAEKKPDETAPSESTGGVRSDSPLAAKRASD